MFQVNAERVNDLLRLSRKDELCVTRPSRLVRGHALRLVCSRYLGRSQDSFGRFVLARGPAQEKVSDASRRKQPWDPFRQGILGRARAEQQHSFPPSARCEKSLGSEA